MSISLAFISLGCDKNLVDSEVMLGICQKAGLEVISDESKADIIVVNTCCFIQDALEESIETIVEVGEYKKTGRCRGILVTGCLGQRYQQELFQEMPEVDAILGTASYEQVAKAAKRVYAGENFAVLDDIHSPMADESHALDRVLSTAGHYAYLKIAEGCDNHCTYCVIPSLRGKFRSRHLESLLEEAKRLAQQGVQELILVAQDTALYGKDLYGQCQLPALLHGLCAIEGIRWVRLLYCYPEHLTEETIAAMAAEPKVCHYIDMPIQHGDDRVLTRMGRKNTAKLMQKKIASLRQAMPDIAIRTTLITGFPGETEEEFSSCLAFIQKMRFDRLGVFTYSQEEGTPAARMEGQIDEEVKAERKDRLMAAQQAISQQICEGFVGKEMEVLIEGKIPEDGVYCGRSYRDAPEIDGFVFVQSDREHLTGDMVTVQITAATEYDLYGKEREDGTEFAQ